MDLMRILRSLEEFLYELAGWLVFYPRTLWRIMRNPPAMARYALQELGKPVEQQFPDSISPVLMLILSVVLAHGVELASREALSIAGNPAVQRLFSSEEGLLLTRSIVFSGYALIAALVTLRRQHSPVNRETLRAPFAIQAFLISPFVVMLAFGNMLIHLGTARGKLVGGAVMALSVTWYVAARIGTYHALTGCGWWHATAVVAVGFLGTTALVFAFGAWLLL